MIESLIMLVAQDVGDSDVETLMEGSSRSTSFVESEKGFIAFDEQQWWRRRREAAVMTLESWLPRLAYAFTSCCS